MCDTWVALADATLDRRVLFGKNSDRPIFDCQPLVFRPRQIWPVRSRIRTEYAELDQVPETYAHLGSRPYWCWGYEEGINEYSVVIGNEAIFTRTLRSATHGWAHGAGSALGLLGMDLIRLGLERARTAREAVECMGQFVTAYGQFGSGIPGRDHAAGGYDNSFLIADPTESWVLEAVGRHWAAQRWASGWTSISNQLSIRAGWDLASSDVQAYAVAQGWWSGEAPAAFDFARAYTDECVSRQVSQLRTARSRQLLAEQAGQITPRWMMRIARDHYEDTFLQGPYFDAADPDFLTLCMHVSAADFTWGNTATSCVAQLPDTAEGLPVFWWTPGPPCNGCYVPFFVQGSRLPKMVSRAGTAGLHVVPPHQSPPDAYSPDSYWWLFRRLIDAVKGDLIRSVVGCYPARNRRVRAAFDPLEGDFAAELPAVLQRASRLRGTDQQACAALLDEFTDRCVQRVVVTLQRLLEELDEPAAPARIDSADRAAAV
jgi:secernin